jgi:hypothetical protein
MTDDEEWIAKKKKPKNLAEILHFCRQRNLSGSRSDYIFSLLQGYVAEHLEECLSACSVEADYGARRDLLEIISELCSEQAIPLLNASMSDSEEGIRFWAEHGLRKIGTKAARKILWEFQCDAPG